VSLPDSPFRYNIEVPPDGRIEVNLPFPAGSHVTVIVMDTADAEHTDLLSAALSSTDFWNNPEDDEDWNHA
jgi:hypothetical protein